VTAPSTQQNDAKGAKRGPEKGGTAVRKRGGREGNKKKELVQAKL